MRGGARGGPGGDRGRQAVDVLLLSLGTTSGLRAGDETLAALLADAGASVEIARVRIGAAGALRRAYPLIDLVEATAARRALIRALARTQPRAVIISSTTAALMAPPLRVPYAVRLDAPARLNRPGAHNAIQHALERRRLAEARLVLPFSRAAAEALPAGAAPAVVLPQPIEPSGVDGSQGRTTDESMGGSTWEPGEASRAQAAAGEVGVGEARGASHGRGGARGDSAAGGARPEAEAEAPEAREPGREPRRAPHEPRRAPREPREPLAVAYTPDPKAKGLDIVVSAWAQAGLAHARLEVFGVTPERARAHLAAAAIAEPPGVLWRGSVPPAEFRSTLRRARVFLTGARWEDFGFAQLEALADGALLVCGATGGAFEALTHARELAPRLCAQDLRPESLARALRLAFEMPEDEAERYRAAAAERLAAYSPARVRAIVAERVLPALLG